MSEKDEIPEDGGGPMLELELDLPPRSARAEAPLAKDAKDAPPPKAEKPRLPAQSLDDDGPLGSGLDLDFGGDGAAQKRSQQPRGPRAAMSGGSHLGDAVVAPEEEYEEEEEDEPVPIWSRILAVLAFAIVGGASLVALLHFVHRPAGWNVKSILWPALDGSSVVISAIVALVALAMSLLLGLRGFMVRGRAYSLLVSSAAGLLFAVVMITVTFSIEGGASAPVPEASVFAPFPVFGIPLGLCLRAMVLAWRAWATGVTGKLKAVAFSVAVALMLFSAVELAVGAVPALRFEPIPLRFIGL